MVITKSFNLDINTPWKAPTLYIKQGDVDSRKLQATIRKDGTNYSIPGDVFATFRMHKPDDTFVTQDCTISGSVVSVVMDAQCATATGHGKAEFILQTASEVVSTFLLAIEILPSAVTDGDIESRDALGEYRTILEEMLRVKGAPLVANTAADMTDTDRVYVYTGSEVGYVNGDWYYYDGDSWEVGGTYNSQGIGLAYQQEVAQMVKQSAVASESDSTPYLFRPTPNPSAILADEEIVGGTVAHNQLVQTGASIFSANRGTKSYDSDTNTFSIDYTSVGTNTGLYSASTFKSKSNHVYLLRASVNLGTATAINFGVEGDTKSATVTANAFSNIATLSKNATDNKSFTFYAQTGGISSGTVQFRNIQVSDVTAALGSQIADYLYTLESGTAGAGVAKLREWGFLSKVYFPYNAGSLISVNTEGKEVTGFNLWDEEWEVGGININTGEKVEGPARIRSKNPIKILNDKNYYLNFWYNLGSEGVNICFYDSDNVFISGKAKWSSNLGSSEIPSNAQYLMFGARAARATYNHDICINLSDSNINGLYRPYRSTTYPTTPTDLNGIFKLDANNQLYADGDIYPSSGQIKRRYALVDLGTLNWTYYNNTFFYASPAGILSGSDPTKAICPKYPCVADAAGLDKVIYFSGTTMRIYDSSYTTAAALKTSLSGAYLVYALDPASYTTDTADPYPETQIVGKGGTERWIDNRSVPVPVGHRTTYYIGVPDVPANANAATLKATVSGGKTTLSWS